METEPQTNHVVTNTARQFREGWEEAFQRMAEQGDDCMLDEETHFLTEWEEAEWQWDVEPAQP